MTYRAIRSALFAVIVVLTVVMSPVRAAAQAVETEEKLYGRILEKIRVKLDKPATEEESLKLIKTHLTDIAGLCREYVTKFPKGGKAPVVKAHLVMADYYLARYSKDAPGMNKVAERMEALLTEHPRVPEVLALHGVLFQHYAGAGHMDKAAEHIRRLAETTPDENMAPAAWMAVYQIEMRRENYAGAASALKTILEKYPQSREAAFAKRVIKRVGGIGKPVELKFTSVEGKEINIADYRGKVVLVDFWASWCKPCKDEMPNLVKLYKDKKESGFEIIGISLDSKKATMLAYAREAGMTWTQYYDGKGWDNTISNAFGITGIPATLLVDRKGVLRVMDLRGERLAERVEELLAEKAGRN